MKYINYEQVKVFKSWKNHIFEEITRIFELGLLKTLLWTLRGEESEVVLFKIWIVGDLKLDDNKFYNYFCWITFYDIWLWMISIFSLLQVPYFNFNYSIIFYLACFYCKSFTSYFFKSSVLLDFFSLSSFLDFYVINLPISTFNLFTASFNFFYLAYRFILLAKLYFIEAVFLDFYFYKFRSSLTLSYNFFEYDSSLSLARNYLPTVC
jgi:hypothetical protein